MADSNKILTVSYGTFSCTLEGFDDAFTTMKAIAEYFRDLAADDRFFGAEPPTPDADMLARLASQAAARRVEARQDENGIVLRQDRTALSAPKAASTEVEDDIEDEAPVAEAAAPEAPVVEELEVADAPVADASDDEDDVEGATDEVAEAFAEFEAIAEAEEEQAAPARPVLAQNKSAVVQRRTKASPTPRVQPSRPRVQVSSSRPVRVTPGAPTAVPHPDQSSVAAKLARIRGVVAKIDKGDVPNGYTEDEHADGGATDAAASSLAQAFEADVTESSDAISLAHAAHAEATRAAIAAEIAERDAAKAMAEEEVEDLDLTAAMEIANAPADQDAEDFADDADEAIFDAASGDDEAEEFDEEAFFADNDYTNDSDDYEEDVAEAAPEPRPVARVLKVKRRDFEAAVEDGMLEEDDTPVVPDAIARGESSLSPEDEADLQDELQALEAEIARGGETVDAPVMDDVTADAMDDAPEMADDYAEDEDDDFSNLMDEDEGDTSDLDEDMSWDFDDEDDEDDDEPEVAIAAEPEYEAEDEMEAADEAPVAPINPRSRLLRGADDDMDRIMKETDNHLGDSDGTRRRSAIAHLRAAVAATKAEKQAGGVTTDDEQEVADVYRDDLAQVVRPRRPVARGEGLSRRSDDRPAPLKLVAEQRVDIPGAIQDGTPVRPRRVRMADLARHDAVSGDDLDPDAAAHARAAAANAASFNEFADRVGAASLPDLLEAAASYLAFVEGRDQFTRPQLMVKARQALEDEFSREDGLRHFGRLLREGKLRKVSPGHFAVSDRINFRPEERAAG